MKRRIIIFCLVLSLASSVLTACNGGSSGKSSSWEKDANSAGYEKKNGKWYYTGKGAY